MKIRHTRRQPRPGHRKQPVLYIDHAGNVLRPSPALHLQQIGRIQHPIQLYPYQRRILEELRRNPRAMAAWDRRPGAATIRRALADIAPPQPQPKETP